MKQLLKEIEKLKRENTKLKKIIARIEATLQDKPKKEKPESKTN